MNPGDEKRLEVADRMRKYDVSGFKESAIMPFWQCLGHGYVGWREILDELAGLIDRGTCRNVYNEYDPQACDNGFECDVCGNKVEDYEHYAITGKFEHCPGCGRMVVE